MVVILLKIYIFDFTLIVQKMNFMILNVPRETKNYLN